MKKLISGIAFSVLIISTQLMPLSASAACISVGSNLSLGSRGSSVSALQTFLAGRGYPGGGSWMVTGYYGKATAAAVRNFQREQGLAVTGFVDSATRSALSSASCGTTISYPTVPVAAPIAQPYLYDYATYPYANNQYSYGYVYPPTFTSGGLRIDSLSVNTGGPGTSVTIWGSGFDYANNTVYFGGTPVASVPSNDGSSLTFVVPSYASTGNVSVTVGNSRGQSNTLAFNMIGSSYYPYQQYTGNYNTYPYDGTGCNNYYGYNSNCGGTYSGGTPDITFITPASGAIGTVVTVYGSGFSATNNTVHFGQGIIAGISSNDGRAVSFTVPSTISGYGAQSLAISSYNISVTNSAGLTSNQVPFSVTSLGSSGQPTIGSITGPTTIAAGTQGTWSLTVNNQGGGYLTTSVNWGDQSVYGAAQQATALVVLVGQQVLTFTHSYLLNGTYTATFTVTNSAGVSNTTTITVVVTGVSSGTLSLSSVSPSSGRIGTQVVITGNGFTSDNTVHFASGGTQHLPSYNGTTIYYTIPAYVSPCDLMTNGMVCAASVQLIQPGSYQLSVTNGNGTTGTQTFTVFQ